MTRLNVLASLLLASILAFAMPHALAGSTHVDIEHRLSTEQLHATGLDTLSPAQMELLNRLLRDNATDAGPDGIYRHAPPQDPHGHVGLEDGPIHGRLRGALDGWQPGTVFELDNGQLWKVLKGKVKLPESLQAPPIVVVPGVAGRWFLQVDEDLPKARVYRID